MTKALTREKVIQILDCPEVYNSLDLMEYFDPEKRTYPTIYELLAPFGVKASEIDDARKRHGEIK